MKRNLTKGNILTTMYLFALPMIAGNLLQQIYNIADSMIVGKCIGPNALAAVGSAYTLMTFLTSIVIGLCMGSGALYSISYGAKEQERFRAEVRNSAVFIFAVTLLIYLIVLPGTDGIIAFLRVPTEVVGEMRCYIRIIFCGTVFVTLYNFFAYILRAMGDSFTPLMFIGIASLVNIVLDLLFVLQFHWGVAGAAAATVVSQALSGVGMMCCTWIRHPFLRPDRHWLHPEKERLKGIIANDIPTCLQQSVMNFGILMIQGLVNSFGATVMAAFSAAVKIDTLAYMPAQEFANAYSIFVSQNLGAKAPGRIRKGTGYAFASSISFCVLAAAIINLFAGKLMTAFVNASETAIIREGVRYLRIEGSCYIGIGCLFLFYAYFRGAKHPRVSLLLTVVSLGTRVLLAYLLAPTTPLGVLAIWWAIPIGWGLADLTGAWLMRTSDAMNAGK